MSLLKKYFLAPVVVSSFLTGTSPAQTNPDPSSAPGGAVSTVSSAQRSDDDLDKLVGPIALYPDELLATVLAASVATTDLVMANRFVTQNGPTANFDTQPWDDSVKALAHYPEVLSWMDQNLEWTQQLGQAFATQSDAVMNAVQRLRSRAIAVGSLASSTQQQVISTGGVLEIVPAQPNVVYVPRYDPEVVYEESPPGYDYSEPYITYGSPLAAGAWFGYDFDWNQHRFWVINRDDRERYWRDHRGGRTPFEGRPSDRNDSHRVPWHAPANQVANRPAAAHLSGPVAPPRPINGTPPRPANFHAAPAAGRPVESAVHVEPGRPDERARANEPARPEERGRTSAVPASVEGRGNVTITHEQNPPPAAAAREVPAVGRTPQRVEPARAALPANERENPAGREPVAVDPRERGVEPPRPAPAAPVVHQAAPPPPAPAPAPAANNGPAGESHDGGRGGPPDR